MSTVAADRIFVGREAELALLQAKLGEARAGEPRVVLVEGPAGIGKTALLQRFVATSGDVRLLRGGGVQEESLLPFGVAEQLAHSARTPVPEVLATLGRRSERSPEPMAVGAAFVELLGTLQQSGAVVIIVDDVQWVDRPTLLALLFALRRLHADHVLALFAGREASRTTLPEGLVRLFSDERGATVRLSGLDVPDLQALGAAMTRRRVPVQLAMHLRDHTGGSPLHVRSLLEELPPDDLSRVRDTPLPAPKSFSLQVLSRLAGCPPEAQRLVVAAAVLGEQCPLGLARRLAGVEDPLTALEGAISGRLLEARDTESQRRIAFSHALVRAAVYHDLGPARRATLHRQAAQLVDDESSSLRHRVAASTGEDSALAEELAAFGRRESGRGAWGAAGAALLAASRLSPAGAEREQLLLKAAECLGIAGDMAAVAALDVDVARVSDTPRRQYVRARTAINSGRIEEGERLLQDAWERCSRGSDRELRTKVALELAYLCILSMRGAVGAEWARRALTAAEGTRLAALPVGHVAELLCIAGRVREVPPLVASLPDPVLDPGPYDGYAVHGRGFMRWYTDDLSGARADFIAMERAAARWGPLPARVAGLGLSADVEYLAGFWDDAIVHAELARSLGEDAEFVLLNAWVCASAVAPLAGRGEWTAAESCARRARESAQTVPCLLNVASTAVAHARLAAAKGDHQAVVDGLEPVLRLPRPEDVGEPGGFCPWQPYHGDALVSLGRLDDAEAVLVPFEALAADRRRHSALTNAARVRGNLEAARGNAKQADAAFSVGLEHAEAVAFPFDRALLEMAYGTFLRRRGRRTDAVTQLQAAQARFAQLGARPYLENSERRLAECGVTRRSPRDPDGSRLTPQELSVAKLVASGMSNPKVAAELFVSINTVEFHLKNVYGKLGIHSRDQLAKSMATV